MTVGEGKMVGVYSCLVEGWPGGLGNGRTSCQGRPGLQGGPWRIHRQVCCPGVRGTGAGVDP